MPLLVWRGYNKMCPWNIDALKGNVDKSEVVQEKSYYLHVPFDSIQGYVVSVSCEQSLQYKLPYCIII